MKRKLEFLKESGALLMALYRIEGTERLVLVITDFGHDYRNSFWEIRPEFLAAVLARIHEKEFGEEVARLRDAYAQAVPTKELSYDTATKSYFLSDDEPAPGTHVP
jgi:hypothetical protein